MKALLYASLLVGLSSVQSGCAGVSTSSSCTQAARWASKACEHEHKCEFWKDSAGCAVASIGPARSVCVAEVKEKELDDRDDCQAILKARLDVCSSLGEAPYRPTIDPDTFVNAAVAAASPNPFFPLIPGTTYIYEGSGEIVTVTITDRTVEILGAECLVVKDVVKKGGELVEETDDWYAQDVGGNVWYMGEISRNYEDGELVDVEGSWKAGRDTAMPGILMPAPGSVAVGDVYRQEFLLGEAEDMGVVLSLDASAVSPGAVCSGTCLQTGDYTPLEPGVVEHKFYAPGVGLILEEDVETGERLELVKILRP